MVPAQYTNQMKPSSAKTVHKGRGAVSNPDCRYQSDVRVDIDDDWQTDDERPKLKTSIIKDNTKSVIAKNTSPDVPFENSLNPYRGCEHGCIYCFARPTHAYLDMSPGLDFETKLVIKPDAPKLLEQALRKKNFKCQPLALGSNTDPYQPIERDHKITRQVLEVLAEFRHPVAIITKSSMIERDIDILSEMSEQGLAQVMISVCTLDKELARSLEPRASAPARRLQTIQRLNEAGIPTGVLVAPMIPVLNDPELEMIIEQAKQAGVNQAGYILLRLPLEVAPMFEEWLHEHYPLKAEHVLTRIRDTRNGALYQNQFGARMHGEGAFAAMISQRFEKACRRFDLNFRNLTLNNEKFAVPERFEPQMTLF